MRVWPLAIGLQEQVANHHERFGSKALVVSVMDKVVHHSDRGSQYVSIRYTERLAEAGIEPPVGSRV